MRYMTVKNAVVGAITIGGAVLADLLGGMDKILYALIWIMAIDYVTGCLVALVFKRSKKTDSGAYSSKAGFKGIVKKAVILICVLACTQLDIALGLSGKIRALLIMFFIANEFLSIIENTGLMGVPWPESIKNMLETLRDNSEKAEIPGGERK